MQTIQKRHDRILQQVVLCTPPAAQGRAPRSNPGPALLPGTLSHMLSNSLHTCQLQQVSVQTPRDLCSHSLCVLLCHLTGAGTCPHHRIAPHHCSVTWASLTHPLQLHQNDAALASGPCSHPPRLAGTGPITAHASALHLLVAPSDVGTDYLPRPRTPRLRPHAPAHAFF